MSQHDFDITTADANTGTSFRAAVNAALQALASTSSGSTEPATMYAYQLWADTTSGYLKIRNATNTGWVTVCSLTESVTAGIQTQLNGARNNWTPTFKWAYYDEAWTYVSQPVNMGAGNTQYGYYTRIGKLVFCCCNVNLAAKPVGAYTGYSLAITNLPHPVSGYCNGFAQIVEDLAGGAVKSGLAYLSQVTFYGIPYETANEFDIKLFNFCYIAND